VPTRAPGRREASRGVAGEEDIRGIRAFQDGSNFQAGGSNAGEVFEAVDGGIYGAGEEGILDFFCEEAL